MNPTAQYAKHKSTELALEEAFIAWVKWPDAENDAFWKEYLATYPGQAATVATARRIVEQVRLSDTAMPPQRAVAVWAAISTAIDKEASQKPAKRISLRNWISVAAAIIIIAAIGSFLLLKDNRSQKNSAGTRGTSHTCYQ